MDAERIESGQRDQEGLAVQGAKQRGSASKLARQPQHKSKKSKKSKSRKHRKAERANERRSTRPVDDEQRLIIDERAGEGPGSGGSSGVDTEPQPSTSRSFQQSPPLDPVPSSAQADTVADSDDSQETLIYDHSPARTQSAANTSGSNQPIESDSDGEWPVDRIVAHRTTLYGTRMFKVKWVGSNTYRWFHELGLSNCVGKLKEYLSERPSLAPTSLVEKQGGCASIEKSNKDNWISIDTVIASVNRFRNSKAFNANIEVKPFDALGSDDCIFILLLGCHFYVILHLVDDNMCWIADGSNQFIKDRRVNKQITSMLKIKISSVNVNLHVNADNCGSAAVMIALKFKQFYKSKTYHPEMNLSGSKMMKKIRERLHPKKSMGLFKTIEEKKQSLTCNKCNKSFRFYEGTRLAMHMAKCRQ